MPAFFEFEVPMFTQRHGTSRGTVMAMETDTPGILLTEADSSQSRYRLTHRASGMLITGGRYGMTDDVFGLLQVAADLGEVADWTQDGRTVAAIPGKVVQDVLLKARF